jgi:hypothetical protein
MFRNRGDQRVAASLSRFTSKFSGYENRTGVVPHMNGQRAEVPPTVGYFPEKSESERAASSWLLLRPVTRSPFVLRRMFAIEFQVNSTAAFWAIRRSARCS